MLDQGELFSIPNPCRGICQANNRGYCKGCLRSREERFHWHEFTPYQQQIIINLCEKRRRKILQAQHRSDDTTPPEPAPTQQELFPPEPEPTAGELDGRPTNGTQQSLF